MDNQVNVSKGAYYSCKAGYPLYTTPKFTKEEYKFGSNSVKGQAFLRQRGGKVVTCAGEAVIMYPDTKYFNYKVRMKIEDSSERYISSYGLSKYFSSAISNEKAKSYIQSTTCDAHGNFEFNDITAGKWIIDTVVSWDAVVTSGYVHTKRQGGRVKKHVTVYNDRKNKFILNN